MRRRSALGWLQHDVTNRGITAWLLAAAILAFYIVLYFGRNVFDASRDWYVWNFTENMVFVILAVGIAVVGAMMIRSDLQEPETIRSQHLRATIIGLISTVLLTAFVYFTPALVRLLSTTEFAKSMAEMTWGSTGNMAFQIIYGLIGGAGVVGIFAYNKDKQQPKTILSLLGVLLVATTAIIFFTSYLVAYSKSPNKPQFSLWHGVNAGFAILQWPFVGFSTMVVGGISWLRFGPPAKADGHGLPANESNQRFISLSMALSFLALFVAIVHAFPTMVGALHTKQHPFDALAVSIGLSAKTGQYSEWLFYGMLYTVCITAGGSYMIWKYWHNKYQVVRTTVVMFVQATIAFSIPWILKLFQRPDYYFSYIWPLKIDYFYPSTIAYQMSNGLPVVLIVYSFAAGLVLAPLMAIFFGKRWYCSWVCGCGGLANTFGEPWRHLSNKSSKAWMFEKFSIHFVMVSSFILTIALAVTYKMPKDSSLYIFADQFKGLYGLGVSAVLSGVVGVGLYPLNGTRVWCRFACPMAAMLGLLQKLGRFQIRVKRDMCISCGLCSKYCEMGIDVRSYAQSNENFTRASCVGCGLCSEVCPRGVLRLENVSKFGSNLRK
ncbi:MAG: 4Fe-4S binding protein [Deltaproteobacteria bacterium]|nr:MAG: 4Fe-4S binding protein [Deltaproteobacteria bacterium]